MSDKKSIKKHWAQYFKALQKQEWDKSLVALKALKELEPENPQVHLRTGDLLQRTNDLATAIISYHEAAQCLLDKGFDHKAIAVYKVILKIDPDERNALEKLRELLIEGEASGLATKQEEKPPATQQYEEIHAAEQDEEPTATERKGKLPAAQQDEEFSAEIESPLFISLSSEEIKALISDARHLSFNPGEHVIKEGDVGDSIFVIKRGTAHVSASIRDKTIHLATLGSGDTFGEVAYLTGRPRTATVSAEGKLEVIEIGKSSLKVAIEKNSLILDTLEEFFSTRVQDTINRLKQDATD